MIQKEIKYIDAHAHVNFDSFDSDRQDVLNRAKEAGVVVVNVGTSKETSQKAVDIADLEKNIYAIVGLHPIHTSPSFDDPDENEKASLPETELDLEFYKALSQKKEVVAIGECGLDYFHVEDQESIKNQIDVFKEHIFLAKEVNKPLMLHLRNSKDGLKNAYKDALDILKESKIEIKGNSHFFAGSIDDARGFIDLGFTFSFGGAITFAKNYEELVKFIPIENILSETDCPYVAPVPYRGKRNEPSYVIEVVKKISQIKNVGLEEVSVKILENAKKLFGINFY